MRSVVSGWWLVISAGVLLAGCGRQPVERVEWTTMGTVAAVQMQRASVEQMAKTVAEVKSTFADVEKLLNAHDPNSELSRLAPLSEAEILERCCLLVKPCYEMAFDLMRKSDGAFNPRWRGTNTLDLGAIAKGFAVDRATVKSYWCILVDLGGNLRAVGSKGWKVGIAGSEETLMLTNGMACATSGEYYRGKHIYDGRTGLAVTNDVKSVTVVHPTSAMLADGLSTTLFVLGRTEGEKFLKHYYPEARAYWVLREN